MAREKRKDPSPSNLDRFAKAVEDLNSAYEREQMQYVEDCAARIKAASDAKRASESWRICNEVTGRKRSNRAILKADSPTERVGIWKDHFEKLLAPAPSPQVPGTNTHTPKIIVEAELPIDTEDFTMAELGACLKGTSNNKATGLDGIPAEVWKFGGLQQELLEMCNSVLNGDKPDIWSHSRIIPIPK